MDKRRLKTGRDPRVALYLKTLRRLKAKSEERVVGDQLNERAALISTYARQLKKARTCIAI